MIGMSSQDSTASALRIERGADRVHAVLDRPAVRNAIDAAMVDELHELCRDLEHDPKILILSGTAVPSCANDAATTPCAGSTPSSSSASPACRCP